jgi:hypothetical protein
MSLLGYAQPFRARAPHVRSTLRRPPNLAEATAYIQPSVIHLARAT